VLRELEGEMALFGRSEQGTHGMLWSVYDGEEGNFRDARLIASFREHKDAWGYIDLQRQLAEVGLIADSLRAIIDNCLDDARRGKLDAVEELGARLKQIDEMWKDTTQE